MWYQLSYDRPCVHLERQFWLCHRFVVHVFHVSHKYPSSHEICSCITMINFLVQYSEVQTSCTFLFQSYCGSLHVLNTRDTRHASYSCGVTPQKYPNAKGVPESSGTKLICAMAFENGRQEQRAATTAE